MRFTTLFFDLDDTLYPSSTGLWPAIKDRMNLYMMERLCIPEQDVPILREQYFKMYGTTLRGLQERHNVDKEDFLTFVHDLPLQEYLKPNPIVREVIAALPTRNFIFTNADVPHARRVLAALQLEDLFETVVDVNAVAPFCKPMPESFAIAMWQLYGLDTPTHPFGRLTQILAKVSIHREPFPDQPSQGFWGQGLQTAYVVHIHS